VALGAGAFIGCLPFYGFHLLLVAVVGWLFRLNRLRMYVAANISNPVFAPALIFAEIQLGAWLRRGDLHDVTVSALRSTDPWVFGADLLLGSVVLGAVLGAAIVFGTLAAVANAPAAPAHIEATFAAAADRYFEYSITAWEFARGKLRRDPVYRAVLEARLPSGATLADIGCGQGLTLAALVEARRQVEQRAWPDGVAAPPMFSRMIGIETRARVAALARRALGEDAEIIHGFAPEGLPERMTVALLLDVLHLMQPPDQQKLLKQIMTRLAPGGVLLVREADAAGGSGFKAVQFGNRLKNVAVGNWRQTFHFRTADEWELEFAREGWSVRREPMGDGTPFANVLFRLTRLHQVSDPHNQPL
jgi:SAM-dependent methyltransferase